MSSDPDNLTCAVPSSISPLQNPASKAHLSTLARIVKAQIGLLASNLTTENYAKIAPEMKGVGLVETYGEDIRQHLIRFLLTGLYKQPQDPMDRCPQLLQLREMIGTATSKNTSDNNSMKAFVTFAETFSQFCKSDSAASLIELDSFFTQLRLDSFEQFVLSSLLYLTASDAVAEQAKTIASIKFKNTIDQLSNLGTLPGILLFWCVDAINKCTSSGFEFFSLEDIQMFAHLIPEHCTDENIINMAQDIQRRARAKNDVNDEEWRESLLSKRMLEAGYECCSSLDSLRKLFGDVWPMEKDVAVALGFMARTYTNMSGVGNGSPVESNWNVENFVTVIQEKVPDIDWMRVIENFDYPHFFLYDVKGLEILVRAWRQSPRGAGPFPINMFFGKWRNLKGQLSALYQMARAPTDILSTAESSDYKVIELEDFSNSSLNVRNTALELYKSQLNSLDLIECVLGLSDTAVSLEVKVFIEMMVSISPELVFLGFLQAQNPLLLYQKEILSRLLLFFLTGHPSNSLVLTKLWLLNPNLFFKSILEMYETDSASLSRILDILHELKILSTVLGHQPFFFTIDLAALASQKDLLNLDKWLREQIAKHKDTFIHACLEFLSQKMVTERTYQDKNSRQSDDTLLPETANTFLRVLSESQMGPENTERLNIVHSICIQTNPMLSNASWNAVNKVTEVELPFSADVDREANSYYEKIYSGEMSIDEMTELLTKLKQSKNPRDQDVYACMIHILLDEYQFFPKYPEKELSITSALFGSLIQHHLMPSMSLGVALQCILDAVRHPVGSKMFNFGHQTLLRFQSRLAEWPQFCLNILQIPHMRQSNGDLMRYLIAIVRTPQLQLQDAPTLFQQSTLPVPLNNDNAVSQFSFTAIHIPQPATDDREVYESPAESIQDRIMFIINNVASHNIDEKFAELAISLNKSAYRWFSNYLVQKRVSLEPNYHELYLLLLDLLDSRLLYQHVLRETFINIQALLNSEKTVTSSSERNLLKNLGSWLGGLTLARSRPIKHKHLDFKELLLEGFDNDRLIVVIPFVCKVLEQCNRSVVFKPPNPWLMAIVKLLAELYRHANLKLNLKFEIEVLCKTISIEVNEIQASSLLQNRRLQTSSRASSGIRLPQVI
ncbi:hypothetical protein BX666DRAFT_2118920 [Dichotomocladium elegans]|nr:hypothetical protein BX666DRAFT_2118920 [Dichotomocladium elegans]